MVSLSRKCVSFLNDATGGGLSDSLPELWRDGSTRGIRGAQGQVLPTSPQEIGAVITQQGVVVRPFHCQRCYGEYVEKVAKAEARHKFLCWRCFGHYPKEIRA